MKLTDYLKQKNIDRAAFAQLLGCSTKSIQLWEAGRLPRKEWREKIVTATGGAVRPADFLECEGQSK